MNRDNNDNQTIVAFAGAILFILLCLALVWTPASAATYYVRADGGTATQCNGTADAPASAAPNCAWNHPFEALPPSWPNYPHAARIKGGDTLIIGPGSYRMGWTKGRYDVATMGDPCAGVYASGCTAQPIPSGTATAPTRILGAGWDTGCKAAPELWGTQAANQVLDLTKSSNVVIACLELTDHSNCTYNYGPSAQYACNHTWVAWGADPNYGDWASKGIYAADSSNITLQDLRIHGFADMGVQAGRISNWTVTRVAVRGNGNVGWNGDLGGNNRNSTNSGKLTFTDLTIAWNGCTENYPAATIFNCYGQNEGGYGDGFAEAWTGGDFVFIRPRVYGNTQDGLDLLYTNGEGSVTIDHGYFARNAGNDVKTSGNATITYNVFIADCAYLKTSGKWPSFGTPCRAGGGEFANFTGPGQTVVFAHNTMIGNVNGMFGGDPTPASGSTTPLDATDVYEVRDNIFIGVPAYLPKNDGRYPFLMWAGDPPDNPATIKLRNNLVWHIRDVPLFNCQTPGIICVDPKLKNMTLDGFDPTPLPGSPAIGTATGAKP